MVSVPVAPESRLRRSLRRRRRNSPHGAVALYIQVGAFADEGNAQRLIQRLQGAGIPTCLRSPAPSQAGRCGEFALVRFQPLRSSIVWRRSWPPSVTPRLDSPPTEPCRYTAARRTMSRQPVPIRRPADEVEFVPASWNRYCPVRRRAAVSGGATQQGARHPPESPAPARAAIGPGDGSPWPDRP